MLDKGMETMTGGLFSDSKRNKERGNISYQTAELLSGTCKQSAVDAQSRKHRHVVGL